LESFSPAAGAQFSAAEADIESPRPDHDANSDPTNLGHGSAWLSCHSFLTRRQNAQNRHSATARPVLGPAIGEPDQGLMPPTPGLCVTTM
jgi:hypothetical protein